MKKAGSKATRVVTAVFDYISTCCSARADKPPCAPEQGQVIGVYLGAKPAGESSLGSWRCTQCRKPCSVTRSKKAVAHV